MADGSFQTIRIHRSIPIIAGYLQLPPNRESDKTAQSIGSISLSPSVGRIVRLGGDTGGASTAGTRGTQELYELDGVAIDAIDDGYNDLKDLIS